MRLKALQKLAKTKGYEVYYPCTGEDKQDDWIGVAAFDDHNFSMKFKKVHYPQVVAALESFPTVTEF